MKNLALLLLAFALIPVSQANAMSRPLPQEIQDELVSRATVHTDFSLRASNGSLITLRTDKSRSADGLKILPAEKGADHSKCGKQDIELIIALTDATLNLVQKGALSDKDVRVIQKTPRCEPYLELLGSLGGMLDRGPRVATDVPEKLSVIKIEKGYAIQLKMKSGALVLFRINSKLEGVKSLRDLSGVRLESATTGQNVGIRFAVTDQTTYDPTRSRSRESCTVYETIRGKTIAIPGHRRTVSDSTLTSFDIEMTFTASTGQTLMTAKLTDLDSQRSTREGPCFPDRDFDRDGRGGRGRR